MDELDLDIDNYDLTELWALFNLENGFTKTDLKSAYRIVLKTHPDKSGLPKEYFLFFSRAFKMIKKIFEYTNKEESCPGNTNEIYQSEYNENLDVSKMNSYDKKRFQSKFNELFEKVKITDDADSGYSDWLEENNSGYDTEINNKEISNTRDLHDYISNKKEEQRNTFLTTYKGIQELESNLFGGNARGSGLIREKPESYSSGLFSKLSYEDLKKAHTETLIPVTHNDFENRIGFNTVQELQTYRKQSDTLVGEKDSIHILKTMKEKEDRENVENAYKMMKQMEQIENKHNEWNSYFKQLTN